jgi:carbamoyltransferase
VASIYFLGISAFYHDSAAALVGEDGKILYAISEERITRVKGDRAFPKHAVLECLSYLNLCSSASSIKIIVCYYESPWLKAFRIARSPFYFGSWVKTLGAATNSIIKAARMRSLLLHEIEGLVNEVSGLSARTKVSHKVCISRHHISHALAAFHQSNQPYAYCLTCDGVGENICSSIYFVDGISCTKLWSRPYPHSLGLLYATATSYLGFKVNYGECKLMGLAPYGNPQYVDFLANHLIRKGGSKFELNLEYFDFSGHSKLFTQKFIDLMPAKPLPLGSASYTQAHLDLAASFQALLERQLEAIFTFLLGISGRNLKPVNISYSGGVALNCKANKKIFECLHNYGIDQIFVNPASGDAGSSVGAALYGLRSYTKGRSSHSSVSKTHLDVCQKNISSGFSPYLGRSYSSSEISRSISQDSSLIETVGHCEDDVDNLHHIASLLSSGYIIALFQGRDEFGPRALGNRSILASPLGHRTQSRVNQRIKYREDFRPFAPVVPDDFFDVYFSGTQNNYMLVTAMVRGFEGVNGPDDNEDLISLPLIQSPLPAITHVDGSARVQAVAEDQNPFLYRLLHTLYKEYSHPAVLLNTSFNVRGEPIVHTPEDAIRCFLETDLDYLLIEGLLLKKRDGIQLPSRRLFEPD